MKIKTFFSLLCIFGLFGWFLGSCEVPASQSEIPKIKYKSLVIEDRMDSVALTKKAVLTFSFSDGDGNIGVSPQDRDTVSQIHYVWHQKLPDGTYEIYQFLSGVTTQKHNIPYSSVMDRTQAQNKLLKGTIEIAIDPPSFLLDTDTMRVEFYIVDRAKNPSIPDRTPDFNPNTYGPVK